MSVLASIRPDSWNLPLLVHVLGAMVLTGATVAFVVAQLTAGRAPEPARMRRFAFRTLLVAVLPAYIVMRVGAQWIYSKEFTGSGDGDPSWVGVGFGMGDLGLVLIVVALILAGVASRRSMTGLARASGVIGAICLVGWLVAIWAMGAKPT